MNNRIRIGCICFLVAVATSEIINAASTELFRFCSSNAKRRIFRNQGSESTGFLVNPTRIRKAFSSTGGRSSSSVKLKDSHLNLKFPVGIGVEKHDTKWTIPPTSPQGTSSSTVIFSESIHHDDDSHRQGIRLNKVFKATHSRREADALIEGGRVSVNGQKVDSKGGFKVIPFVDKIELDGKLIEGWEAMNGIMDNNKTEQSKTKQAGSPPKRLSQQSTTTFEYIKYWKPRGITCTTDRSIRSNIIDDLLQRRGYEPEHRVFPVGRLDKDTSGLILLTSDGRLPNSALRGRFKQPKVYHVLVNRAISEADMQQLRDGVVITTVAQRDGNRAKPLTAKTLPCQVQRLQGSRQRGVSMTLVEGRNRQIRKMMAALGYEVVELHRVEFMGITLDPLQKEGDWIKLGKTEMNLVQNVLKQAAAAAAES